MLIAPGIYSVELGLISRTIPELLAFSRGTRTVANFWLLSMVGLMFIRLSSGIGDVRGSRILSRAVIQTRFIRCRTTVFRLNELIIRPGVLGRDQAGGAGNYCWRSVLLPHEYCPFAIQYVLLSGGRSAFAGAAFSVDAGDQCREHCNQQQGIPSSSNSQHSFASCRFQAVALLALPWLVAIWLF